MSMKLKINSFFAIVIFVTLQHKIYYAESIPIYFPNSFTSRTPSEPESENISIYTTTESSANQTTESNSVYYELVRNIIERISGSATEKIIKTTTAKSIGSNHGTLEIVDDVEILNSTSTDDEDEDKETVTPSLITRVSHPDRYVSDTTISNKFEEDDMENEIGYESVNRKTDPAENPMETNVDSKPEGRFYESGVIMVMEYIASAITLVWGAINALFPPKMEMPSIS